MRKRLSNIELFRIFSMLLIISLHFTSYCINVSDLTPFTPTYFIGWFIRGIAYISVNCYVLISAYFLCKETEFRVSKVFSLLFETWFYSFFIYFFFLTSGQTTVSFTELLNNFFPVLSAKYWFVTIYFGLYLLSPFLNWTVRNMGKSQHFLLCILLIFLFSIIPTFFFYSEWLDFGSGYGIVWFVVLYYVAAYIRNYITNDHLHKIKIKLWVLSVIFWILPLLSKLAIAGASIIITGNIIGSSLFYSNNSIIILVSSILTFVSFMTIEIKNKILEKIILFFAKCTFGVYLIHDNDLIRAILWAKLRPYVSGNAGMYILSYIIIVIFILVICSIIDYIRQQFFKFLRKFRFCTRIDEQIKKVFDLYRDKYKMAARE